MAKQYRVGPFVRISNAVTKGLLRLGVPLETFSILVVRGRKSGRPIETPVAVFCEDGHRYLIASYGIVNWVRNLRAADGDAVLKRRRAEHIHAVELPPEPASVILRAALHSGPPAIPKPVVRFYRRYFVLPYLDVGLESPPEDFRRAVADHPVFRVEAAADPSG